MRMHASGCSSKNGPVHSFYAILRHHGCMGCLRVGWVPVVYHGSMCAITFTSSSSSSTPPPIPHYTIILTSGCHMLNTEFIADQRSTRCSKAAHSAVPVGQRRSPRPTGTMRLRDSQRHRQVCLPHLVPCSVCDGGSIQHFFVLADWAPRRDRSTCDQQLPEP